MNSVLGLFTVSQAKSLKSKVQRTGPIKVDATSKMSFVELYQNSGMVVCDPMYISLGELWDIAEKSLLTQYELSLSKVSNIAKSLLSDGVLRMDPSIAVLPDGRKELVGGRHRAAAIKLWFEISGKLPQEFKNLNIRVLSYQANSTEAIAARIEADNASRNMTQAEKSFIDLQSKGIEYTTEGILENAERFSAVKHSSFGKALGMLMERAIRKGEMMAHLTPDTALRIGKAFYLYVYSNSEKEHRKEMKQKEILELLFGYIQDNIGKACNESLTVGNSNVAREGLKFIVEYLGSRYVEEELN